MVSDAVPQPRPRPSSLRRRVAKFAVILLVAVTAVGWTLAVPAAQVVRAWDAGSFSPADESLLFSLTNQARASAGLAPLRWDAQLAGIARWRVQDMSTRDYFSHQIPPQGYEVFHYMDQRGVSYVLAGENIGWVSNIADDAATAWIQQQFMNSPEHRANILGALWDAAGVGAYKGADGKFLYCVLFKESGPAATPRPVATPRPTVRPTPKPAATATPRHTATPGPTTRPTPKPAASSRSTPTIAPSPTPDLTPAATTPAATIPSPQPTEAPAATVAPSLSSTDAPPAPATPGPGTTAPTQRIANDAPPPGLLESLIGGLFGLVSGS